MAGIWVQSAQEENEMKVKRLVIETTGMIHCLGCAENFLVGLEKEFGSKDWKGVAFCPFCGVEQKHITLPEIPTKLRDTTNSLERH